MYFIFLVVFTDKFEFPVVYVLFWNDMVIGFKICKDSFVAMVILVVACMLAVIEEESE